MNLKEKTKKHVDDLHIESKIAVLAGFAAMVGCFFTWKTGGVNPVVKLDTFFDTRVEVVRYSIILFSVVVMILGFFPTLLKKRISFGSNVIILLLGIESFLFAVIAMSFLLHASSDPTLIGTENIGWGLMLTLGGSIFMALAGYMGIQRSGHTVKPVDNQEFLKFPEKKEEREEYHPHEMTDMEQADEEDDDDNDQQQSFI